MLNRAYWQAGHGRLYGRRYRRNALYGARTDSRWRRDGEPASHRKIGIGEP